MSFESPGTAVDGCSNSVGAVPGNRALPLSASGGAMFATLS
jgi:hypothetical protein